MIELEDAVMEIIVNAGTRHAHYVLKRACGPNRKYRRSALL
jgi:hypothetical protein